MDEVHLPRWLPWWVSFDSELQCLDDFLAEWKPSCTQVPRIEWICVSRLKATKKQTDMAGDLMRAWSSLCKEKHNNVTDKDAQKLGLEHNVKSGKWLIYLSKDKVDDAWKLVANAVIARDLETDAKVLMNNCQKAGQFKVDAKEKSLKLGRKDKPQPVLSHVICVYSNNFSELHGVLKLRGKLWKLGFKEKLSYKPDAYTFCGIYHGNIWNISPIMYRAY